MAPTNFYLAASAVLPILVFADTVRERITVPLKSAEAVERLNRAVPRVMVIAGFSWWPFYAFGEWDCLRSLEVGHPAAGGTTFVWIALGMAFFQLAGVDMAARLVQVIAPDEQALPDGRDEGRPHPPK